MPLTNPSGTLSQAEQALRVLLADTTAFRTWTDSDNQAEALARIHCHALPPPASGRQHTMAELDAYRPFALIWTEPEGGFSAQRDTASGFSCTGRLRIRFEDGIDPDDSDDPAEAFRVFCNALGGVLDEMLADGGTGSSTVLALDALRLEVGPYRTHEDELATIGDAIVAEVVVEWSGTHA